MKTRYTLTKFLAFTIGFCTIISLDACEKFIKVGPPKIETVSNNVFASDVSATSAIRGIYSLMATNTSFTNGRLEEYTGIASDELINYATRVDQLQFYQNSLTPLNVEVYNSFWLEAYKYINNANAIIEGVSVSTGMTPNGKKQIEGEAKFVRAYCYFYLATLFGDVPYLTTTDYQANSKAVRMPFKEVLLKIEMDLLEARNLLQASFSFSNNERIQPNKGAATALLARLYLYLGEWGKAETMSSELINNITTYSLLADLDKVFLANSKEAIWQLKPVVPEISAPQGQIFILTGAPNASSRRVSMTPQLIAAFGDNNQRKSKWLGTFTNTAGSWSYIYKYKDRFVTTTLNEYEMVFRLAEQYLIRAEAKARLGDFAGARNDINSIRNRAGLLSTSANDLNTLLIVIEQERFVELCGESGLRWLDLKRNGRADAVLSLIKPQWQKTDELFPIPESDRLLNPNLKQNPGY
jgi:hypothetical protein